MIQITNPIIPSEKLSTNISSPGLTFPSTALSNARIHTAATGPKIIPATSIVTSAPTTAPIVANAPITPPRRP